LANRRRDRPATDLCQLWQALDHAGFVIEPGRFAVTRVERRLVPVVQLDSL
jgi:hypothetical protein